MIGGVGYMAVCLYERPASLNVKEQQVMINIRMLVKFKHLAFDIRQQYRHCEEVKRNMAENKCIIHFDSSGNYMCKYVSEIQAMHFGTTCE